MISLEEIIKQNSLLPPIMDNGGKGHGGPQHRFGSNMPQRSNNFAVQNKRKAGFASYSSVNGVSNNLASNAPSNAF